MKLYSSKLCLVYILLFYSINIDFLQAAVIIVSNTNDTGAGSLRNAITTASAGDEIQFDEAGVFATPQTILLNSEIMISIINLTINGNGKVILDGKAITRILNISATNTTINNIKFQNGKTAIGDGGAINYTGINLTLNNCTFEKNIAINRGGAIYTTGTITFNKCAFIENESNAGGGAIYTISTFTMNEGNVSNNKANNLGVGGGIYIQGGTVKISKTTIKGNSADEAGGIFTSFAILEISQTTISDNNSNKRGGGIFCQSGTAELKQTTLSGNKATSQNGGAIFNQSATLTLLQSTLYNNEAANQGGGIYNNTGSVVIRHTTIAANAAFTTNGGGGIYNFFTSSFTVQNSIISNNSNRDFNNNLGTITANNNFIINTIGTITCTDCSTSDPKLGTFGNYGGLTQTIALQRNSPAIDASSGSSITTDQRGFPIINVADVGAFEFSEPEVQFLIEGNPMNTSEKYTFADVQVGNSSTAVSFTMQNLGTGNLIITVSSGKIIQLSGANSSDFILDETNLNDTLNPNKNQIFTVKFIPTNTGVRSATITVVNNDFDEGNYVIFLEGNGIAPPVVIPPPPPPPPSPIPPSPSCFLEGKTPIITRIGDSLKVDLQANAYQWIINGQLVNIVTQSILIPASGTFQVIAWEGNCSSEKSAVFTIQPNEIKVITDVEIPDYQDIKLYPNPTQSTFMLSGNLQVWHFYQLQDTQGKVILMGNILDNSLSFDLSTYPSGMYFLTLYNAKGVLYRKIIKQ